MFSDPVVLKLENIPSQIQRAWAMRKEGGAKESKSICSEFEAPRSLRGLHGLRLMGYCTWTRKIHLFQARRL